MVNRPEPTRRTRHKALDPDNGIQLEMLDYIHTDEEVQQIKNILLDTEFWKELSLEVRDARSQ